MDIINTLYIGNTDNSTSITSGSIHTEGGQSIKKDLWVGGDIYCNSVLPTYSETPIYPNWDVVQGGTGCSSFLSGSLLIGKGTEPIYTTNKLYYDTENDILRINGTIDSVSHGSGSLTVGGGLGVSKSAFIGFNLGVYGQTTLGINNYGSPITVLKHGIAEINFINSKSESITISMSQDILIDSHIQLTANLDNDFYNPLYIPTSLLAVRNISGSEFTIYLELLNEYQGTYNVSWILIK